MESTPLRLKWNFRIWTEDSGGHVVQSFEGHNIFLDTGRTWLSQVLAYQPPVGGYVLPASPPDAEPLHLAPTYSRDVTAGYASPTTATLLMPYLPFYIGFGIGGNQQSGPIPTDVDTAYPGSNVQTDSDRTITGLERPVRIDRDAAAPPTWARWLMPINTISTATSPYRTIYTFNTVSITQVNQAQIPVADPAYAVVPISEAALYRWDPTADYTTETYAASTDLTYVSATALAYKTFPPINKTTAVSLLGTWSLIVE